MGNVQRLINTLKVPADIGILAANATTSLDLAAIKRDYGDNLNTLQLVNNSAVELLLYLDGKAAAYIKGNGSVWSFDWRDGIWYSDVQIKNNSAATNTAAQEVRVTCGITGVGIKQ